MISTFDIRLICYLIFLNTASAIIIATSLSTPSPLSRISTAISTLYTLHSIYRARICRYHPSDELVGPWRTKNISPLYNEAGVKKFAFLYPAGSPTPPTNGQNMPDEKFPTGFFSSESELRRWLSS